MNANINAQSIGVIEAPGIPDRELIPNQVKVQEASIKYGNAPPKVEMVSAQQADAALGVPPWYAAMIARQQHTNPEVGYHNYYADVANGNVDPAYEFYQRRNRMYDLMYVRAVEMNHARRARRLGSHRF